MKKNILKAGLIAILASTALMGTTVYAEDGHKNCQHHMKSEAKSYHGDMRKMFKGLDLTDEQKVKVKSLMKDNLPTKEDRQAEKAKFLSLITAENFDETKVKELIQEKKERSEDKRLNMLKVQNKIYLLLTPEQQENFKENFEKNHSRKNKKSKGKARH
ncbi:MAG: Spy/CpxP family protein refolding chaperone [Shewanella sp.]